MTNRNVEISRASETYRSSQHKCNMKTKFIIAIQFPKSFGEKYEIYEFTVIENLDNLVKDPFKLSIQITGRRDIISSNLEEQDISDSFIELIPMSNANNNLIGVLMLKVSNDEFLPF